MGYTKDIIKGLSWLSAIRIVVRGLIFIKIPLIARILSPSQVGIFALAAIVLAFAETLTETGINIFLVQKRDSVDKYISTAWIVSILRGAILSLIIFISAQFIVPFFEFSDTLYLIQLISIVPLLRGFINPSVGKFIKDLHFKKEFIYRTSIIAVESIVSVVLVLIYESPTSLVWGMIAGAIFEIGLSFIMARPIPAMRFKKNLFGEIVKRGKWFTTIGIFSYMYQNLDDLVVGKLLGSGALGLYDYVYKISMLPITEIADVIIKTAFPVFVKFSEDKTRLFRAYLRILLLTLILSMPLGVIFFLFPETILRLLLGEQWISGADILRVLAILGVVRALSISVLAPFYALEKQEYVTLITVVGFLGLAATVIPFVQNWGLVGAGYAALVGSLFSVPFILYFLRKVFKGSKFT